ncbi:uncharacterized protein BN490_00037 [Firmicutes bacterium CAG:137]|nr:uncharacterized protein BN490_00037 [Firmicutes bacterium CAG:137]
MKKLFCVVLIVLTLSSLSACGSKKDKGTTDNQTANPSVSQGQSAEKKSEAAPTTSNPAQSADGIDVDLTKLSSTMVYSEVYNMMYTPDDYIGKTVKMKGQFAIGYVYNTDGTPDESTARFACVIADATACCSQGLEFILTGEHTYPDDYPELGNEITVTGTFELYEEDGFQYCRLADAEMVE